MILVMVIGGLIIGSRKISFTGIAILIICSLPILSSELNAYLEKDYQLNRTSDVDTASAIVVLSGMVRTIKTKDGFAYEWTDSVDRIFAGIDLFKENKAPFLILTGGKLPWSVGKPEGEYLRDVAMKYGIPKKYILLSKNVENTDQEAKAVRKILSTDDPKVILVTSAFHMPRAKKVFEAAGITVIPFPVDFRSGAEKLTFMNFIPSAAAFYSTSSFIREIIGRAYYNLKY